MCILYVNLFLNCFKRAMGDVLMTINIPCSQELLSFAYLFNFFYTSDKHAN